MEEDHCWTRESEVSEETRVGKDGGWGTVTERLRNEREQKAMTSLWNVRGAAVHTQDENRSGTASRSWTDAGQPLESLTLQQHVAELDPGLEVRCCNDPARS